MEKSIEMTPPTFPPQAEVGYTIQVRFRFNITPFVAQQKVNTYLLLNVGQMVSAGEPTLLINQGAYWKVPIFCAFPSMKRREYLGELVMDAESGAIVLNKSSLKSASEIETRVDALYDSLTALSART
ncbi:MAG: hypothetical protein HY741_21115 [Chloroflexi bacterium]|nr:hypothetical protein [Chloroflexota bacterium]